ncbi:lactoferrin/transferrin family TonB-dependent receptor [Taylorella equigenitalis]|uniref:Outer membrane receptor for lactoferrin or transferrin, TonB-dependent protein A n=3 Tax=Taylorella equigenitalis TaxID=29575 RepID=A0A654KHH5_TAYEM|nr:lactoferrin/transferrin family TonB-dependent receptor [Taylorella equigenitalis]ADU91835.1 Outer membrane receptor for lactoferrin or transferrin, TonB-dependent protein A [Taylorella equigenitalis MCE9]AFN35400.1 TonB dependent-transferrin binding protein [Taylorella equigenitalis ATCC 35865]ASY37364.1 lactoferrin/transferrin family TonB-dependent receptor [Taylorella equigenitalis]ASY38831.1 lactoferrin/transferrin family TonB-dependent receptor [Taylorella equigenitalis]ASY41788.1 lacto
MLKKQTKTKEMKIKNIKKLIFLCALGNAYILPQANAQESSAELDTISVEGYREVSRTDNEVTGLGKVVKSSQSLRKEMVNNIRDLTRYDPGISVVEQGRGASSGYSIRGVDKNRVGLLVDGIPQIQSYVLQGKRNGSGAINEIEYENLSSIEISKGASSSEYGSGALGGAVGFRTKEVSDVLDPNSNWNITNKTAYISKNKQLSNSTAIAGRYKGFEALFQFTQRKGHETSAHEAIEKDASYEIGKLSAFADTYDLRRGKAPNEKNSSFFILKDECPTLDLSCAKPKAAITNLPYLKNASLKEDMTPEELEQLKKMQPVTEKFNAKNYTGALRALPDPMKYESKSWFGRIGKQIDEHHYIGALVEDTVQTYDIRDMTERAYFGLDELDKFKFSKGIYRGQDLAQGLFITDNFTNKLQIGLNWSRTLFIDEKHKKNRYGLIYKYDAKSSESPIDSISLRYDNQSINIENTYLALNCAKYPNVDKNCRPSADKPNSYSHTLTNNYKEKHNLINLSAEKEIVKNDFTHTFKGSIGYDRFTSELTRTNFVTSYASSEYKVLSGNGFASNPYIYEMTTALEQTDYCNTTLSSHLDCVPRVIKGSNLFGALQYNLAYTDRVKLGLGLRYDRHIFKTEDRWTGSGKYSNLSYNFGLVVKPINHLSLAYRFSTGYRVPSFRELFGYRVPGFKKGVNDEDHYVTDVKPERALNSEYAVNVMGNFGNIEASYFKNTYKDMIAFTYDAEGTRRGFRNAQNVTLEGFNVVGKIFWDGVLPILPEGLYSTIGYNRIKLVDNKVKTGFARVESYLLDSIQPSRLVLGLGYDDPYEKWGVNLMATFSKPKNVDELKGSVHLAGSGNSYDVQSTKTRTNGWKTFDMTAYFKPYKYITLRAGVYNIFNYKYVTWESLRQTAMGAINRNEDNGVYTKFAAPGRNFALTLELKY